MKPTREDLYRIAESVPELLGERIIQPFGDDWWRGVQDFITETTWEQNGSVNVFRVEGTTHPDYAGMTWGEFLRRGKRMEANLRLLESNPEYYLRDDPRSPGIHYRRVDGGPWYVTTDGLHRTCIAKALFALLGRTSLHGVTYSEHVLDRESWLMAKRLRAEGYELKVTRTAEAREDGPGWRRDLFRVEAWARRPGGEFELAASIRRSPRKRFFFWK